MHIDEKGIESVAGKTEQCMKLHIKWLGLSMRLLGTNQVWCFHIDIVTIYTSRSVSEVQNIATFIVVAKFDIIVKLLVSQPTIILSVLPYVMLRSHVDTYGSSHVLSVHPRWVEGKASELKKCEFLFFSCSSYSLPYRLTLMFMNIKVYIK
jgi:hypothetical protein